MAGTGAGAVGWIVVIVVVTSLVVRVVVMVVLVVNILVVVDTNLVYLTILSLAPHGAQAVIAFSHYYSTVVYFPNILLKPLKTNV